MEQRLVYRYSNAFKRQVVEDLERGRFSTLQAVGEHYGITGKSTIAGWLRRFGKNSLITKVVRVEKLDEQDEIRRLKQELKHLQRVLGMKEAQYALEQEFLNIACQRLGEKVEDFKKKADGTRCPSPGKNQESRQ